ncbi:jockey\pol, partial [Symbiodinium sp. CCMP2592]
VYEKRAAIWNALDALVQALPSRHFMYLAGDFNTDLLQEHPYVGVTHTHKGKERAVAQDQHIFQNLLRTHGLRALNSWDNQSTYVDPHGPASRVDFVLARTMQATGCPVTVQPQIHFASWRSGARHMPLLGMIDLKAWCRFRDRTPAKLAIDQDALCRACRPGPELEILRQAFAAKQHLFTADLLPSQAEAELRNICVKAFPLQRNRTIALQWQNPEVGQDLSLTWQLRRSLKQQAAFWPHLSSTFRAWRLHVQLSRRVKELKRNSRRRRREHWQAQLSEAEQASKAGNPLKFFQVVQRLAPKRAHARVQIRDPKGQILTPALEDKALADYWQGIYSSTSLPYQAVCLREPLLVTQQELHDALRGLKQRKAVAKDLAPAAVWKALASLLSCYLNAVLSKIWQPGPLHIPSVWARSDLHFLLKPQKVTRRPQDVRPIALQSAAAKAVLTVFKQRLQPSFLEAMRTLPQYAYVMGRSTHEAISRVAAHCKEVRDLLRSQSLTVFDRFEGARYTPCIGGAQLWLDLSKAFDLLPRRTLQLLLRDTDLSLEEQQVLLEWHQAGKYRIHSKGNEHPVFVRLECGVRQGCVLSPFLWGLFTKHIQKRLDEANGPGWTARRGTLFADDMHFKWVFRTEAELHSIRLEVLNIFRILRELGMQANPDKSTFIIGARGQQARKWVKRWVRKDSDGRKQFHFGGAKQDRVPVASQLTYLGVVLSYRNFELATANHRIGVAAGHRDRLRRILHARRVLSVGHRLRLWRIMVQTSQLYAVEAVGLTAETAKLLHIQTMRHMRANIGSARHVDGDSDQLFMLKHSIPDCVELVKTKCDAFCQRLARTELEIPCFGAEGILQWAQFVRDSLPPPYIAKPRSQPTPASSASVPTPVPEDSAPSAHPKPVPLPPLSSERAVAGAVVASAPSAPTMAPSSGPPAPSKPENGFSCAICDQVFSNLHDLKTHEGKAHKKVRDKIAQVQHTEHGYNGFPICRHCGDKFSKWSALTRHVTRQGCPALERGEPEAYAKSQAEAMVTPHVQRPHIMQAIRENGWESLLTNADLCVDLKQRCALCYQWDPVLQEKQLWGHLLPSLEEAVQDWPMNHDDSKGDKPSEAKSKDLNKRRRTNDNPSFSSDKQDRKGKGKGKGKTKSSKDASKMELKEAVQLMAAMTLQLVDQASRVQLDTSFLLTMKNEPGPENLLPIMYKVWKAWKTMQEQEPSKLDKPLRCSMMISMLLEIKARAKKLLDDSEQQERMKALEWIDSEGRWVYRKWSPTQEALYLDQSRKPIPQTVFIEQLDQAMTLLVRPENMPRFQSRELAPEMKGYAVTFHVDIGLRSEAEPLWQIFNTWVDLQAWGLGAVRIRPHRLKRPPAADRLSVWLGNH